MAINIAKEVAKGFSGQNGATLKFGPAVLTKFTPGIRQPGNLSGGTNPTSQDFKCRGMVSEFTAYDIANSLAQTGDRKVLLLGATIEQGAVPAPTDRITIAGEVLTISNEPGSIDRDPVGATYICRCMP